MANRHLSVATAIEKNRISSSVAFVIALEIRVVDPATGDFVETLRVVNNDEELVFQGNTYAKGSFTFDVTQESGSTPDLTVQFNDYSRDLQSRMQQYAGGVGFEVKMLVINTGNLDQPPEVSETLQVTGASAKDYIVTFKLGIENPLTRRFPFRRQLRDNCPWIYKGSKCKYSGDLATCDYTLQGPNGCATHNNQANFGGFPGIKKQ